MGTIVTDEAAIAFGKPGVGSAPLMLGILRYVLTAADDWAAGRQQTATARVSAASGRRFAIAFISVTPGCGAVGLFPKSPLGAVWGPRCCLAAYNSLGGAASSASET